MYEANENAEWRAQLERLRRYLGALTARSEEAIEPNDLIDRLTRSCFAEVSVPGSTRSDELLDQTRLFLQDFICQESTLEAGGFVFEPSELDLQGLVDELPAWTEMEQALLELGRSWISLEAIYTPATMRDVEEAYARGFDSPPHPHWLADVFSMLMTLEIAKARSPSPSSQGVCPAASRTHLSRSEHWRSLCVRALELGHHLEEPSLRSLRAFSLCSIGGLHFSKDTGRLRSELSLQPLQVALLYQLGLNQEPALCEQEPPVERYERRALATLIIRFVWWFSSSLSQRGPHRWDTFTCQVPAPLSFDDLTFDSKYEAFRADPNILFGVDLRTRCALLTNEFSTSIFAVADAKEADVKDMAARLRELAELSLRHDWGPGLTLRAQLCCLATMVTYNQHYCMPAPGVNAHFFRAEALWALHLLQASMLEYAHVVESLQNVCFASYDCFILAALLLSPRSSVPTTLEQRVTARQLLTSYFGSIHHADAPRIPSRLAHTVGFLLHRDRPPAQHCTKRSKTVSTNQQHRDSRRVVLDALDEQMPRQPTLMTTSAASFTFATDSQLVQTDGEAEELIDRWTRA